MKKTFKKMLILLSFVLGLSLAVSAQTAKRIEFAAGKSSAVVKGVGKQTFVIKIGGNKDVKLKVTSKGNKATYSFWDGESDLSEGSDGRSFEGHFETAGDRKIEITAPKGLAFTLTVTIK